MQTWKRIGMQACVYQRILGAEWEFDGNDDGDSIPQLDRDDCASCEFLTTRHAQKRIRPA